MLTASPCDSGEVDPTDAEANTCTETKTRVQPRPRGQLRLFTSTTNGGRTAREGAFSCFHISPLVVSATVWHKRTNRSLLKGGKVSPGRSGSRREHSQRSCLFSARSFFVLTCQQRESHDSIGMCLVRLQLIIKSITEPFPPVCVPISGHVRWCQAGPIKLVRL